MNSKLDHDQDVAIQLMLASISVPDDTNPKLS